MQFSKPDCFHVNDNYDKQNASIAIKSDHMTLFQELNPITIEFLNEFS